MISGGNIIQQQVLFT